MMGNLHQNARGAGINGENNIHVEIVEEPQSFGNRFRYEAEGRSPRPILGVNSTIDHRSYPKIKIRGYHGRAGVVVSLVTVNGPPYFPHPYNLIGESCRNGVCFKTIKNPEMICWYVLTFIFLASGTIRGYHGRAGVVVSLVTVNGPPYFPHPYNLIGESSRNGVCFKTIENPEMICCFSDLRIQCVKRSEIRNSLETRERYQIDPFATGFSHSSKPNEIHFNAVRLCFQVFLPDSNGHFHFPLPPVISEPIYDKNTNFYITKLSHCSAPASGGQEVSLLCANIYKGDIEIVFYEEDDTRNIWSATVNVLPGDVYSRNAILFKTPAYKNPHILKKIDCFIQLRRPSDGSKSIPKKFILLPLNEDLSPLSENLGELHRSGQFCDFIIKVKDREFPVHKAILAARSPVFESMLLHDMKEKITSMVHIPDCEPNIFEDFLFYLYSGKSEKISSSTVTSLYDVAEKYDVKSLKKDCVQFMKGSLTVDLIIDVLTLAVKYTDEELLEYATEFFISNNQMIILTTKWQDLFVENPALANELMEKVEIVSLMET